MNKNNLKSFAPQARKDFIAAVTVRAQQLGFTATGIEDATLNGDVLIINGVGWPARVSGQREKLKEKISQHGFAQTMEEVAYTWFNRFAALRYMELHDFLDHGHRVLSSRDDGLPELLRHASDVTLPGLNAAKVTEMQLAGNRDNELYKLLLVAQCNELSRSLPFLFERIDDETELLLPDNLLRTDSIIAKLVAGVPEDDWQEIEVIGWLYQFYISEKKDQVIGKVVKSEDIPAATQLFTPNWIVQYLVQNSVGRLWLMANPQSTLAKEWPYYITPAEQTPEVQAQLDALIQTRVREDGDTLNPESITVLDPACGSGHILVVAYDVLKAIYLERGYRVRDIPRLILEKNLYGLDIDDRAAQMAGFALLMKARADDRRLFTATDDAGNLQPPKLNVLSLQESKGLSVDELTTHLAPFKVQRATITALVETFEHAKTFGSLIQIPYALKTHLTVLPQVLALVKQSGDMYATAAADDLLPLVQQALVTAMQFDAVVANPPYLDRFTNEMRNFSKDFFPRSKSNTYAMFVEKSMELCKKSGVFSLVTLQGWMFNSTFEDFRLNSFINSSLTSMLHFGTRGFDSLGGEVVSTTAFCSINQKIEALSIDFINLTEGKSEDEKCAALVNILSGKNLKAIHHKTLEDFSKIPGSPIAYWANENIIETFKMYPPLGNEVDPRSGMATGNNDRFLRSWYEVNQDEVSFRSKNKDEAVDSKKRWFPYNKGGTFRKWFGNNELLVFFENDGELIKQTKKDNLERGLITANNSKCWNQDRYFLPCLTWSALSNKLSMRFCSGGFIFDTKGQSLFAKSHEDLHFYNAFLNSSVSATFLEILTPTLDFNSGYLRKIPDCKGNSVSIQEIYTVESRCLEIAIEDWNAYETSWDFKNLEMMNNSNAMRLISKNYEIFRECGKSRTIELKKLEERNNEIFSTVLNLNTSIDNVVPLQDVTLTRNPYYRYGVNNSDQELEAKFKFDTVKELISFSIGCMMGRYSLDEPGLIYAHAGNVGFDPSRYATFPADADGIVPITDELWFADDACSRIRELLRAVWGPDTLDENCAWLAKSLGTKASETPDESIRRYIADKFFKDHLQTYKKRPIYWLFSSGRQGAFQALVYLHRYNESTLARMRAEYVIPLTAKMASRLEMLEQDANAASSAAARTKIRKQIETLRKKQTELLAFDENLRHFADMRITLDLDDGVKVNYGKFRDLLEGVKIVTGGGADD